MMKGSRKVRSACRSIKALQLVPPMNAYHGFPASLSFSNSGLRDNE